MRTLILGLGVTLAVSAGAAEAQIVRGAGYPMPGRGAPAMRPGGHVAPMHAGVRTGGGWAPSGAGAHAWSGGGRWQQHNGRWIGGWNAPGGWSGYRQPYVGWSLPGYWVQPGFVVNDWAGYGLAQPPVGYSWSRYYDDAVLIDGRGSVHDTVGGLDWDRYEGDYAYDDRDYARRDSGLGGAAIGAVAGGVAGNLIAGRGDRLAGTLIGAGVGGAAGYAIDRAEDRGRGARYPVPGRTYPPQGGYAPYPGPQAGYAPYPGPHAGHAPNYVSPDGRTVVTTSGYAGGYWGGGSTTTVVVQSAPVVTTTTTTEYVDDAVTYHRPAKRKVWRHPSKTVCRC